MALFFLLFLICLFSVDELRKLLSDKEAYQQFLLSLDQVKIQNNVSGGICFHWFLFDVAQLRDKYVINQHTNQPCKWKKWRLIVVMASAILSICLWCNISRDSHSYQAN